VFGHERYRKAARTTKIAPPVAEGGPFLQAETTHSYALSPPNSLKHQPNRFARTEQRLNNSESDQRYNSAMTVHEKFVEEPERQASAEASEKAAA
jgi:hypothetical protein